MQGTLTVTFTEWVCLRLIPADAGNTMLVDSGRSYGPVHPRAYGERGGLNSGTSLMASSPPRIRGMLVVEFGVGVRGELTPAHTGNDVKASTPTQPSRAHPRAYGERLVIGEIHLVNKSSPPRIRGMLLATRHNA